MTDPLQTPERGTADKALKRLIGIYNADGGIAGELRYLVGKLTGESCGLCAITHGIVGKKGAFRTCANALSMPFDIVHRNERSPGLVEISGDHLPCVIGERHDGTFVVLLDAAQLDACDGNVDRFAGLLANALASQASGPFARSSAAQDR